MEDYIINPQIEYDIVELPSRGIYYPNRKKSVKVSYLTASDENILASPGLIQNSSAINEILKRKIGDKDINIDDLVEEDKEAILVFLRNTAFGTSYTLKITDPKTKLPFETKIDLSTLKIKDFNLEEDTNGEYKYYLEKSKVDITFKFLNKKQLTDIEKIRENWNGIGVAPVVTKELEFLIKSVGGIRDPMDILHFIEKLPILDSQNFRKYVKTNKPGLDLKQRVITPSGEEIEVEIGLGVEFFRPFFGI
jgi:hypothetical protein